MEPKKELLAISSLETEQPFEWSVGRHTSRFLAELRDHCRIVGSRCLKCRRVLVPPRNVCGECFAPMEEFVPLSGKGSVETFTVLSFGFVDPDTGRQKPVPYTWAMIRLDGADNTFNHFLEETDAAKIRVGMRVEAVFEEKRKGHLLDIRHFRTIEE